MHFPQKIPKKYKSFKRPKLQKTNTVDIRYSQRAMYGATMLTQKSKKMN